MVGILQVYERHAAQYPNHPAVCDQAGTWTWAELNHEGKRVAAALAEYVSLVNAHKVSGEHTASPVHAGARPVALAIPRSRQWYALCLGAWRLGIPVVALSNDLPDKAAERSRASKVAELLQPMLLITDGDPEAVLPSRCDDCVVLTASQIFSGTGTNTCTADFASSDSILCYVYTGGTTKHSKCVAVTHAMALWEVKHYAGALGHSVNHLDRVLQYSSVYWGAAVFGQLDVALAFGACTVIVYAPQPEDLARACEQHRISVLGVVPSQLRGAWPAGPASKPQCLRVLISWAEKLPPRLAQEWRQHVQLFELLLASEYWLSFHSDCTVWRDPADGTMKHVLRALPGLDMLLLKEDGTRAGVGSCGELLLSGPTVSPGYVGPDRVIGAGPENDAAFRWVEGRRYLRTRDRLFQIPGGGFAYYGRVDALTKRGGAWVDLEAMQASTTELPGVSSVALVAGEENLDAFVVLDPVPVDSFNRVVGRVRSKLGSGCRVHVWESLPLHAATAKVDRNQLQQVVAGVRARSMQWLERLAQVQRRMLMGYLWWHVFCISTVAGLSYLPYNGNQTVTNVLARVFLMPYLWAASLYALGGTKGERKTYSWRFSPCDILILVTAFVPPELMTHVFACACAYVLWKRDRPFLASRAIMMISVGVCAFAVSETLWKQCFNFPILLFTGLLLVAPSRVWFFTSLPLCYLLALPKWIRDEWNWRVDCDKVRLRHAVFRCCPFLRHKVFDGSIPWNPCSTAVDWRRINLCHWKDGMAVNISFWHPVSPLKFIKQNAETNGANAGCSFAPTAASTGPASLGPKNSITHQVSALVERLGGHPPSLGALDSLQAIGLVESIRRHMGLAITVTDVLRSTDVHELASKLLGTNQACVSASLMAQSHDFFSRPDSDGSYRLYMMRFPQSPVDWYVKFGGPGHLDVSALQRATDRLIQRHSALRTIESPDEAMREAMDRAAATWQLCASCWGGRQLVWSQVATIASHMLFACWPRTVCRTAQAARVQIRIPEGPRVREESYDYIDDDEYVFWIVSQLRREHRWPFDIFVVPLYKGTGSSSGAGNATASSTSKNAAQIAEKLPAEDVQWYIFAGITHAYSDGACGQALFGDLLRMYAEEASLTPPSDAPIPAEPMALLQRRLKKSLNGRLPGDSDPGNDVYHEILCEDWGKRSGMQKRIILEHDVAQILHSAAMEVIGCGIDVAWLTAITAALYRLFPSEQCFHLVLKCACRDGPGEAEMIGFLSEQRIIPVDVGNSRMASLLDIVQCIDATRKSRTWRAPVPYEAGLCVYINIVSSMIDSLPLGCRQIMREAPMPKGWTEAYSHLNVRLDQRTTLDWDFRIFHWDSHWGWDWGTYFAAALGSVIEAMATCPTAAIVPSNLPPDDDY